MQFGRFTQIIIILIAFLLFQVAMQYFSYVRLALEVLPGGTVYSYPLSYFLVGIPCFIALVMLYRDSKLHVHLGLSIRGLRFAWFPVIAVIPMMIGGFLMFGADSDPNPNQILRGAVYAAFFEELYYRGFLFGALFFFAKLGFVPACLVGAVPFALGHLYQGSDPTMMAVVFLVTSLGAAYFAWLYVEWDRSLWVPIVLHLLMNLSWILFPSAETAAGDTWSNLFRALTIALSIFITLVFRSRTRGGRAITKSLLWHQRRASSITSV